MLRVAPVASITRGLIFTLCLICFLQPAYPVRDSIQARQVIRIGFDRDYPPFEFAEGESPAGFDIEIAGAVMDLLAYETEFIGGSWDEINRLLKDGGIDLIAGMYLNPGREDYFAFSVPYIISFHAIFYLKTGSLRTLTDLKNAVAPRVIMQKNAHIIDYIKRINPGTQFIFRENALACLVLLSTDGGDLAIAPEKVGRYHIRSKELTNISTTDIPIMPREYAFAARKTDTVLIGRINDGLSQLQHSGEYISIYRKWFGDDAKSVIPAWIIITALAAIFLLMVALGVYFFWNRQLKRMVSLKTLEISRQLLDKEKAEAQLIVEKARAEESDRLKSAFLANMSHEIRTPMNAIIGFSELMADERTSLSDRKNYYSVVQNNSQVLLNLINDIIDIAKIEAQRLEVNREPVRINALLGNLFETYKNELRLRRKEHISLELEMPGSDMLFVIADEFRLSQVFTNLVVNAIKFTNQGFIRFGYAQEEKHLRFFVKDTGIGIPFDKQQVIFNRFRQVDEGLTRKYDGAGLGLFICKSLVNLMHGEIWLQSQPGVGSEFSFRFSLPG